jgi:exosortase/archaeosortase family protein
VKIFLSILRFLTVFGLIYGFGWGYYLLSLALTNSGGRFGAILPYSWSIFPAFDFIIEFLLDAVAFTLNVLGNETFRFTQKVGITGTSGVFMGFPCLGYQYWVILTGFVFAFPNSIKIKWVGFLIATILLLSLNIARLSLLCIFIEQDYNTVVSRDLHGDFNQAITFFTALFCVVWSLIRFNKR